MTSPSRRQVGRDDGTAVVGRVIAWAMAGVNNSGDRKWHRWRGRPRRGQQLGDPQSVCADKAPVDANAENKKFAKDSVSGGRRDVGLHTSVILFVASGLRMFRMPRVILFGHSVRAK